VPCLSLLRFISRRINHPTQLHHRGRMKHLILQVIQE
jgi:hypothetical protein